MIRKPTSKVDGRNPAATYRCDDSGAVLLTIDYKVLARIPERAQRSNVNGRHSAPFYFPPATVHNSVIGGGASGAPYSLTD